MRSFNALIVRVAATQSAASWDYFCTTWRLDDQLFWPCPTLQHLSIDHDGTLLAAGNCFHWKWTNFLHFIFQWKIAHYYLVRWKDITTTLEGCQFESGSSSHFVIGPLITWRFLTGRRWVVTIPEYSPFPIKTLKNSERCRNTQIHNFLWAWL
jgi:hypothetical protein